MSRPALAAAITLCLPLLAGRASAATTLFTDDFSASNVKPQWSSNTLINRDAESKLTWFSGRYSGNTAVTLTLNGAPTPPPGVFDNSNGGGGGQKYNLYTLTFDFYCIDSWDGNDPVHGPDRFTVQANTTTIFNETFGNVYGPQTMRAPDVGPVMMVFNTAYPDSIYRKVTAQFQVPDSQPFALRFGGIGLLGLNDESWGIDNVKVTYEIVPGPATAVLAGSGLLLLRRRR